MFELKKASFRGRLHRHLRFRDRAFSIIVSVLLTSNRFIFSLLQKSSIQVSGVSLDMGVEVDDYSSTLNFGSKFTESKLAAVACVKNECCAVLTGVDDSISFVHIPGKV
jgi:hypothetical protein